MDINALRVFNSLYDLGISEQEFSEIEDEQKRGERTGLCINVVKKGKVIGVSHDEKHKIVIKEIKGEIKPTSKSRVLFKTLITFNELPEEIYTLHAIAQYRALDTEIRYIATTLEELKDRICDRFIDKYPKELGEMYEDVYGAYETRQKNVKLRAELIEKQMRAIFWLFGEDFNSFKPVVARKNIARIIKVFQRNNRRLAILQINEKWNKTWGISRWTELIERTAFKIITFTPRDRQYNFVSPNREIYLMDRYDGEKSSVWLDDDLFEKVTATELKVLSRQYDEDWILLNADTYNKQKSAIRIELMSARRKEQEENARHRLVRSIERQFRKGKVIRHGITFTKKSISYDGVVLTGSRIAEYLIEQQAIWQERPEFNQIFSGYVDYILDLDVVRSFWDNSTIRTDCNFEGKETITIGKIKVTIEKSERIFFVNNKRICRQDLSDVIKRAISYHRQEDYDKWVVLTSRVNLNLQKVLQQGAISFELRIDKTNDNCLLKYEAKMLLSIPVIRRNAKNYARIVRKEYKIRDTKALLDLGKNINSSRIGHSGGGYLQRTIKLLYRAIDGVTPKEIGDLIRNGEAEYNRMCQRIRKEQEKRIAKSREFIAHAVKLTKATKTDGGYFVTGLTGTVYFVDEKDMQVWIVKNGKKDKYLCIIDNDYNWDDSEDEALRNDRIAKRLLMLSKDRKVAREIYDKGDRMDTHWKDIQEIDEITSVIA